MDIITIIGEVFYSIWNVLKGIATWIYEKIFSFSVQVVSFFKNLYNIYGYNPDTTKALAIIVGKMLEEGGYPTYDIGLKNSNSKDAILTTTYDTSTGELDLKNAKVVEFGKLDTQAQEGFNGKPLLVLK